MTRLAEAAHVLKHAQSASMLSCLQEELEALKEENEAEEELFDQVSNFSTAVNSAAVCANRSQGIWVRVVESRTAFWVPFAHSV